MEKTIYLGGYSKGQARFMIILYILLAISYGVQAISAIHDQRPHAALFAGLFLFCCAGMIVVVFMVRREKMPQVILQENRLTMRLTSRSGWRTIASEEIERLHFRPGRVELFLLQKSSDPLSIAASSYEQTKQLKEALREFAQANRIALTEAPFNPPLSREQSPH
ncbi:MAG TPA: hypothetical protein PKI81_07870 [bacterium]|nr:hypothetical protein [bacterium]HOC89645.1 hypothetical protein [bacterium]HOZ21209.1 hypothetical protein [bacterium]